MKVDSSQVRTQQKMSPLPWLPKWMTAFAVTQVESQTVENTKAVVPAVTVEAKGPMQGGSLSPVSRAEGRARAGWEPCKDRAFQACT